MFYNWVLLMWGGNNRLLFQVNSDRIKMEISFFFFF